ncbi:MAG: hypothetical protein MHM6MM_008259 [Cercozoa sp. M6MM]
MVLRALDSIEDDMKVDTQRKVHLLRCFHEQHTPEGLQVDLSGIGENATEEALLTDYSKVIEFFNSLKEEFRNTISDVCKKMGEGMAMYQEKEERSSDGCDTVEAYDTYCHYVAGLVGYGLSDLFAYSGFEDKEFLQLKTLSNSMGLFLQKTNIIRDYLEDLQGGRTFWPAEIWQQYADELGFFAANPESPQSVQCLNHLVRDALRHSLHTLEYLGKLRNAGVFKFCAVPQAMAMGTLCELYGNKHVFRGVVKMRKGLSALVMTTCDTYSDLCRFYSQFIEVIGAKAAAAGDYDTLLLVDQVRARVNFALSTPRKSVWPAMLGLHMLAIGGYIALNHGRRLTGNCNTVAK